MADEHPPTDADDGDGSDPADASSAGGPPLGRRALLGGAALAGAGVAGYALLGGGDGGSGDSSGASGGEEPTATAEPVEAERAQQLAAEFAPTLYFGRYEKWFPTDPRRYTTEEGDQTVVDGFDALDGYTREAEPGAPPAPTVFHHVVSYGDLTVVDYWFYSAFDQFTTNFHWHDWEVLHVFLDTSGAEPETVLYVASAHSTSVPNNEHIDPPDAPTIISEVGSHSSALGVNAREDTFQRLPIDGLGADVTNAAVSLATGEGVPLAYGLPRDEGFRLPFVLPELDGAPIYEHPRLPNVDRSDLLAPEITVRAFADLVTPPTGLPARETGLSMGYEDDDADVAYELLDVEAVRDIDDFTGPQLSFEFAVPGFVEDAVAEHLTGPDAPWTQDRFDDPIRDVTDDAHRRRLRERFGLDAGGDGSLLVGRVQQLRESTETDGDRGVVLSTPSVEAVTLLESDPVAAPTFNGVVAHVDVPDGDHRLTVNAPGVAPYAQQVRVGDGGDGETPTETATTTATTTATPTDTGTATVTETDTTTAAETETSTGTATTADPAGSSDAGPVRLGAAGTVAVVANQDAVKLEVDASDRGGTRRVRVRDDVAGRVFDAPPVTSEGRGAVYVHQRGAYDVEVTDAQGRRSVERVTPEQANAPVTVGKGATGKASIASFLVDFLEDAREAVQRQLERGGSRESSGDDSESDDDGSADGDATATPTSDGSDATTTTASSEANADDEVRDEETSEPTATATATATPTSDRSGSGSSRERLVERLDAAVEAARAARQAAVDGRSEAADEELRRLQSRLTDLEQFLEREGGRLPRGVVNLLGSRLRRAQTRTADALETPL